MQTQSAHNNYFFGVGAGFFLHKLLVFLSVPVRSVYRSGVLLGRILDHTHTRLEEIQDL